jgi:hypothetical protein
MTILRRAGLLLLWAYAIVRSALDWMGRASLFNESEHTLSMIERGLNWLFSTPWWVAAGLAVVATVLLFLPNIRDYFTDDSQLRQAMSDIDPNDSRKMIINQNVTSYSQSGGITAHTVIGHVPRTVTEVVKTELLKVPNDKPLNVISVAGDSEAAAFRDEITSYLRSVGFPINQIGEATWRPVPRGLILLPFGTTIPPKVPGSFAPRLPKHDDPAVNTLVIGANL